MDKQLFEDSLELLKRVREELHSEVESSVLQALDRAIDDLEKASKCNTRKINSEKMLKILGLFLGAIPAVADIIKILSAGK
jgi:hypothetical protein